MPRERLKKSTDDVLLKSAEMLGWALGGLEREISQTNDRLAALRAQATELRERLRKSEASKLAGRVKSAAAALAARGGGEAEEGTNRDKRRRKMSPAARRRISEMMKKRWAERRNRTA